MKETALWRQRLELAELAPRGREALKRIEAAGWELVELKPDRTVVTRGAKRWQASVRRGPVTMRLTAEDANFLLDELARYTRAA